MHVKEKQTGETQNGAVRNLYGGSAPLFCFSFLFSFLQGTEVGKHVTRKLCRDRVAVGARIGVGRVSCDAVEARSVAGKHGQRPLIHYDYLYLE